MTTATVPICCYIFPAGKECGKDAEFTLIDGPRDSDATEGCADHLGHLMQDKAAQVIPIDYSAAVEAEIERRSTVGGKMSDAEDALPAVEEFMG